MKEQALEKYTGAMDALIAHEEANQSVFDAHKVLVNKVIDAENELRDAVAEAKEGVANEQFKATYTPQTQTWADIDTLNASHGKLLTDALLKEIVKTQDRPGRITVSPVGK
jgi:ClpP class serine protease